MYCGELGRPRCLMLAKGIKVEFFDPDCPLPDEQPITDASTGKEG